MKRTRVLWDLSRTLLGLACFAICSAAPAHAQVIEVGVEAGYTLAEGVNASADRIILGGLYRDLDVTSGGVFGITAGGYVSPNVEVEFLWHKQSSSFEASSPSPSLKLSDLTVHNYHGNFIYNMGEPDAKVRPYFFGGLGATHYSPGHQSAPARRGHGEY